MNVFIGNQNRPDETKDDRFRVKFTVKNILLTTLKFLLIYKKNEN